MRQKTVWITGASSGIGMEFARQYAQKGYRLILTARRRERLEALEKELHVPCRIEVCDLSQEEECYSICNRISDEAIDVFINNAGMGTYGSFLETSLEKEITMLHLNDRAMHILMKQMLLQMQKRGSGTI